MDRIEADSRMIGNEIRDSLKRTCLALNNQKVEYLLIGGVAVGYYGFQRISGAYYPGRPEIKQDIDFWYRPTVENYLRLVKALDAKKTFLRIPFDTFKVEFLPIIAGLDSFNECYNTSIQIELDSNTINIISYNDLLKNKAALARDVDRIDIQELKKKRPPSE
jgi:predicted nucleotidyltransferase